VHVSRGKQLRIAATPSCGGLCLWRLRRRLHGTRGAGDGPGPWCARGTLAVSPAIYGDYERLNPLLKEAGLPPRQTLVGAKLLRIFLTWGDSSCPIWTFGLPVRDMGDHFKISTPSLGDYDTSSTSGMTGKLGRTTGGAVARTARKPMRRTVDDYCPQCREDMDEVDEGECVGGGR